MGTLGQITDAGPSHCAVERPSSLPPAATIQGALMTDLRGFIMPSFIQGFKLAHDRKIALRPLLVLMLACSLITMAMGVYMNVKLGYAQGGSVARSIGMRARASQLPASSSASSSLVKGVTDTRATGNLSWVAVGLVLTYGMMLARSRFAWFPLHPIGLLLSQTYPDRHALVFGVSGLGVQNHSSPNSAAPIQLPQRHPAFSGPGPWRCDDDAVLALVIDAWQGKVGHKLMPG